MRRFLAHSSSKIFTASFQQKRFFQASVAEGATSAAVLVAPMIALSSAVPFLPEKAAVVPAVEATTEAVQVAATEPQANAVQSEVAKVEVTAVQVAAAEPQALAVHAETLKTEPVHTEVAESPAIKRSKFPEPTPVNPKLTVAAGSPCQAPWALANRRWIARFCLFGYGY